MSILPRLFSFLLLFACLGLEASAQPATLKYSENGNWNVRMFTIAPDGFPDTIETSTFPTEREAEERALFLNHRFNAVEKDPSLEKEPAYELRTSLDGVIWTAKESWSAAWEDKYTDWVRENFSTSFLKRYKIKTDCADALVALRWVFSRMMGLPAGNRLSGGGLMTNRSVRQEWQHLPTAENWYEDKRFLAALDYISTQSYTHSIHADSYPIEISPQWLKEGAFHLDLHEHDGHTRIFTVVSQKKSSWPLYDVYSTVPRRVRKLAFEPFTFPTQPKLKRGGILRNRWVRLTGASAHLVPAEQMPGYSLEQFLPDFFQHHKRDFSAEVAARLRTGIDPILGMQAVLKNLKESLRQRKTVIDEGFTFCSNESCAPGTLNYDDWSTPSRDARIGQYFEQVADYLTSLHGDDLARAKKLLSKEKKKKLLKLGGEKFRYDDVEAIWLTKKYSSDPRDTPARRWGQQ